MGRNTEDDHATADSRASSAGGLAGVTVGLSPLSVIRYILLLSTLSFLSTTEARPSACVTYTHTSHMEGPTDDLLGRRMVTQTTSNLRSWLDMDLPAPGHLHTAAMWGRCIWGYTNSRISLPLFPLLTFALSLFTCLFLRVLGDIMVDGAIGWAWAYRDREKCLRAGTIDQKT